MSVLAGLMLWTVAAFGGEFYFEGPVHSARGDAVASSRMAREAGHDARVVRRFTESSGWEYLVRVSGFSDQNAATVAAGSIALALGEDIALYSQEGDDAEPKRVALTLERVLPSPDADDADEVEASALAPTIEAHGGLDGGAARIHAARTVLFKYRRTLPGGEVIDHIWARSGTSIYTGITPVEGEVQASKTLVKDNGAWMAVADGAFTPQDRERSLETLQDLAPERVVPFALSFATLAGERKELQAFREEGKAQLDGGPVLVLRSDGDRASGSLVLLVDPKSHLVRKVTFNDGAMEVQFDGWEVHAGAAVRLPKRIRTWREGKLVDAVEVQEITLDGELPAEWFAEP